MPVDRRAELKLVSSKGDRPVGSKADSAERKGYVEYLFERYKRPLLSFLVRLLSNVEDAEEVLQETYIRILSVPHLDALEIRARGYLFKIATNLARDRLRRRRVRMHDQHVPFDSVAISSSDPRVETLVDWDRGLEILNETLLALKPRTREVFLLHVVEHMSYRNIAKQLKIGTKTVERDMALVLDLCQRRLRLGKRK